MPNRRDFLTWSAAALAAVPLSSCTRSNAQDYDRAARAIRAPPTLSDDLRAMVRYATLAANSHNTQPWRFRVSDRHATILPDFSRRTPVVDPDDHHLFVSLGCAAQNLTIAASALGRPAAIQIAGDGRIEIELSQGEPNEGDLFRAIPYRQSTRSVYDGRSVSLPALRQLEAAAAIQGVSVRILTSATDREAVLQYVLAGNSVQMNDPAFVAELRHWARFNASEALATRDGLYSACTGNPTLPSWVGRTLFPLAFRKASENDKYAQHIRSSAGVAVFVGEHADREHWARVGRAFQAFALQCTALGLCHAHVNQPIEVSSVRTDFARCLGISDARPDLVVRFGAGPRLPMSMRRPVAAVIDT